VPHPAALLAHGDPSQVPPIGLGALLSEWRLELVPMLVLATIVLAYALPVRALRRRGDAWSRWRSAAFLFGGCGSIGLALLSPLAAYDTTLLSVHMVQHMVLTMLAPVFLALGAPVTLWLRTLPSQPRRWLLALVHSTPARVLSFAPVAFAFFVVSPWALYFSGWYEATLQSAVLHELTHAHFVLVGSLFFWPLVGLDPVPGRVPYGFRLLATFASLPFHAFLGITIMASTTLIAGDYYLALDRDWPPSVAADQELAGAVLWASGDLVGLLFFGVLFVQWARSSQREAVREDRRLDRLDRLERLDQHGPPSSGAAHPDARPR
jgi:putative copper resistance protein D